MKRAYFIPFLTIGGILLLSVAMANDAMGRAYEANTQGFHWYDLPKASQSIKKKQTIPSAVSQNPLEQMAAIRKMTRLALAQVVLNHTPENAAEFIFWNNLLTKNAAGFTVSMQQALLDYPKLAYRITHPTQSAARKIKVAQDRERAVNAVKELAKTDGFFFFYRGKSQTDQLAARTLSAFAKQYDISVLGISMDGQTDPIFATNEVDHGQAKKLGVSVFPALLLVNPKTHAVKPVFYGVLSQEELLKRLYLVATNFKAEQT